MRLFDVATELFEEMGSPTDLVVSSVLFWLSSNVGKLNNFLGTSYALNDGQDDVSPAIGLKESVILKKLYLIHRLDRKIQENLGASGTDSTLEVSSDGGLVRFVNKNEVAKTYQSLRKDEILELQELVNAYKISGSDCYGIIGNDAADISSYPNVLRVIQ